MCLDYSTYNCSTHITQNVYNKVVLYHKELYTDIINSQQTL